MKTLIINSSPHKNGNTSFLANLLSKKLKGETDIVFLSDINFKSCCWTGVRSLSSKIV